MELDISAPMTPGQTNRLLGYSPDARLLIINADDFGFCNAINEAIIRSLQAGVVRSTSLMMPCPWALHAIHFLTDHPEIPFGVHLTIISDPLDYRWGPVASRERVSSLVDRAGYFFNFEAMPVLRAQAKLDELEVEFKAQIEAVLAAGLKPAHLDWHALRFGDRTDIFDLMFSLAKEYGLALRVIGRTAIEKLQSQGFPTIDYDFLDSYGIDPDVKPARYAQLLHELPSGLSEWAVHPGLANLELKTLEPDGNQFRQTDFDFWTSQAAKDLVKKEGIILIDYRALQVVWKAK
jgi:predicted glycoside hydrolase/deacetylase ChbG (UPF0249 family)